ncbi:MAG: helix-turn-helix domain-containing protein, partial [Thermoanaerobaculia bacterium]
MNDWRDRLRKAVKRTGKKQCAIAEAAGVSQETLSRVLSGVHCEPKFETVARIVRATRESVAWLLDEPIAPLSADDLETVREAAELLLSRLPEPVEVDEEESPVVGSPPKISTVAVVTMKHGRVFAQR